MGFGKLKQTHYCIKKEILHSGKLYLQEENLEAFEGDLYKNEPKTIPETVGWVSIHVKGRM